MNLKIEKALNFYIFFVLLSSIIYLLIYNLLHYDQIFGYDGEAHHDYVQNFLNIYLYNNDQPSSIFTREFFSPPLPYVFPTIINELCKRYVEIENLFESCREIYSFGTIFFQSILYLLTLFVYLKIVKLFFNYKSVFHFSTLLLLSIFTINYKTVVMLRGEIYILFLNSIILYLFLKLCKSQFQYTKRDIFIFGLLIGLLALSRQWAFLLFPGYITLLALIKRGKKNYFFFMVYSSLIGFLISSWFYFDLYFEYGTFTAFNETSTKFSFSNQPQSFYMPTNESLITLFKKPIRPNFDNQLIPILYADLWGDYWGYFSFTSRDLVSGRNQIYIGDYLARVNIVSLLPTIFYILAFIFTAKNIFKNVLKNEDYFLHYLIFSVLFSFIGYIIFLISYPIESGDTIKSSYIIQMFHMLGLISSIYLEKLKNKNLALYFFIIFCFCSVYIHNFSAMMSHFRSIK